METAVRLIMEDYRDAVATYSQTSIHHYDGSVYVRSEKPETDDATVYTYSKGPTNIPAIHESRQAQPLRAPDSTWTRRKARLPYHTSQGVPTGILLIHRPTLWRCLEYDVTSLDNSHCHAQATGEVLHPNRWDLDYGHGLRCGCYNYVYEIRGP